MKYNVYLTAEGNSHRDAGNMMHFIDVMADPFAPGPDQVLLRGFDSVDDAVTYGCKVLTATQLHDAVAYVYVWPEGLDRDCDTVSLATMGVLDRLFPETDEDTLSPDQLNLLIVEQSPVASPAGPGAG